MSIGHSPEMMDKEYPTKDADAIKGPEEFEVNYGQQLLDRVVEALKKIQDLNSDKVIAILENAKRNSFFANTGIAHYVEINAEVMGKLNGYKNLYVKENGYIVWLSWENRAWHLNYCQEPQNRRSGSGSWILTVGNV